MHAAGGRGSPVPLSSGRVTQHNTAGLESIHSSRIPPSTGWTLSPGSKDAAEWLLAGGESGVSGTQHNSLGPGNIHIYLLSSSVTCNMQISLTSLDEVRTVQLYSYTVTALSNVNKISPSWVRDELSKETNTFRTQTSVVRRRRQDAPPTNSVLTCPPG